jgi:ubiquinone/menaquinone biosynthesis C-methylase UbiE
MADFTDKAAGFAAPTQLPASDGERVAWNDANKAWWEHHPMRYDFSAALRSREGELAFFREIDSRFFAAARDFGKADEAPFSTLIPFEFIRTREVLEIGVGMGSHAQLLASACVRYTGIDLTEYATQTTRRRLELHRAANATIMQMNAEEMSFADASFDYVWSWGVIHHSADTPRVMREIRRVLRPSGRATIMVYYRSLWYRYVYAGLCHGILKGQLFRERSLDRVMQRTIDGALARFYSERELRAMCVESGFRVDRIRVLGMRTDLVLLPPGRVKDWVLKLVPRGVSRFLTSTCRFGYFIVADLTA